MGSLRVGQDLATEQQQIPANDFEFSISRVKQPSPALRRKHMVMAWPLEVCLQKPWTSLIWRILKDKLVWAVIHGSDRSLIF